MKRKSCFLLCAALLFLSLVACAARSDHIILISREEGSGTRGAFSALFLISHAGEHGKIIDDTSIFSEITHSTAVMTASVSGDRYAIGYVSLGVLAAIGESVKPLAVDGTMPSIENVKNGTYRITRPFYALTTDAITPAARDFLLYIQSAQGQEIVEKCGYVGTDGAPQYSAAQFDRSDTASETGAKITITGSSSVAPVIEALSEAYRELNPGARIELAQSDTTMGIASISQQICDIGLASRELTPGEAALGIKTHKVATDAIAVIVNNQNPVSALSSAQIRDIFTAQLTRWSQLVS